MIIDKIIWWDHGLQHYNIRLSEVQIQSKRLVVKNCKSLIDLKKPVVFLVKIFLILDKLIMKLILKELKNFAITIEDFITIKTINILEFKFEIYITVLNKKTLSKKKLHNLDLLLKSLKEEEIYLAKKTLLNNIQSNFLVRNNENG